jgi:hypothetical protein
VLKLQPNSKLPTKNNFKLPLINGTLNKIQITFIRINTYIEKHRTVRTKDYEETRMQKNITSGG